MQEKCADKGVTPARARGTLLAWRASLLVGTLLTLAAVSHAEVRAELESALLDAGSALASFPGVASEPLREIRVNGARVLLRTYSVDAPLALLLDHYEAACRSRNYQMFRTLGHVVGGPVTPSARALATLATSSHRGADRGYVACADLGAGSHTEGLMNAVEQIASHGDLTGIGPLHYAYVERAEPDPTERSFVLVALATSDSLLGRMVPHAGHDAQGRDAPGVPRPDRMQRLLSAWEVNGPSGVFTYVTDAHTPRDLESFYRHALREDAWTLLERHASESIEIDGIRLLSAERGAQLTTILAHRSEQGRTILTILTSGSP